MKLTVFLSILWIGTSVYARPVRGLNPNQDVEQAQVVAVVKIDNITTTASGVQFDQFRVDELNVSGSVLRAIKGDFAVGDTVNFLHRKAAPPPEQTIIINGFSSFRFQPGHNYLLILVNDEDGRLQLPAPEAFDIPEFSNEWLTLMPEPEDKTPVQQVAELLFHSFMSDTERPSYCLNNLRLLQQTRLYSEIMKENGVKDVFVQRLVQIKDTSPEKVNSITQSWLPQFGVYDYLDEAIRYILDENNRQTDRTNAIHGWLPRYPKEMQVKAYQAIVEQCQDDFVRSQAQKRLSYLWDLPREVEEQFQ